MTPQLDSISASTPLLAPEHAEERTEAAASGLRDRVETASAGDPRTGLVGKIGTFFSAIAKRFSPAISASGRLPDPQRAARQLANALAHVVDTLASRGATPAAIESALVHAGTASQTLKAAGSTARTVLEDLKDNLRKADSPALYELAIALRASAAENAQSSLADRPEAAQLLMEIETAVNAELTHRIDFTVDKVLQSTIAALELANPHASIEDNLHFAFDIAVPLVKLGVLQGGDATDAAIDRVVLERLDRLSAHQQTALLGHMNTRDLGRLRVAGAPPAPLLAVTKSIVAEIAARPERLAATFEQQAQNFTIRCSARGPIDRGAFVRDLAELGAAQNALSEHCVLHQLRAPDATWPSMERLAMLSKASVCAELVIESGRFDLKQASPGQLSALSNALNVLSFPDITRNLLGNAQQAHFEAQRATFRQQLGSVLGGIAGGQEPGAVLNSLATLEHASSTLREAVSMFGGNGQSTSSTSTPFTTQADHIENELITESIRLLPAEKRAALASALSELHNQALISALHVGAGLAFEIHMPAMGNRFSGMSRMLNEVSQQSGADGLPGETSHTNTASLRTHRQSFAAQHLTTQAREAFHELYGLRLPEHGPASLRAGRFSPEQVRKMALVLERPASDEESKLVAVGPYKVGWNFHADARRKLPYFVPARDSQDTKTNSLRPLSRSGDSKATRAGEPLIDTRDWPGGVRTNEEIEKAPTDDQLAINAARDERIADGYARLVELCGGNEAQARTLTLYAHQGIAAGILTALTSSGGTLILPDGRLGSIGINGESKDYASQHSEISFSIGTSGRPQIDVDYRLEGRHSFHVTDGSHVFLSPDSRLQAHFRAELQDDGTLKLLETPSCHASLRPAEFQKPYPEPTLAQVRSATPHDQFLDDLMTHARKLGREHEVLAYRALDAFGKAPNLLNAAAVLSGKDMKSSQAAQEIVSTEVQAKVLSGIEPSRPGVIAAFDGVAAQARQLLKDKAGTEEGHRARRFFDQLDALRSGNNPRLFEDAEHIYQEFVTGSAPISLLQHETVTDVRAKLDRRRDTAELPVPAELFDDLEQVLAARMENLVSAMIADVKATQP